MTSHRTKCAVPRESGHRARETSDEDRFPAASVGPAAMNFVGNAGKNPGADQGGLSAPRRPHHGENRRCGPFRRRPKPLGDLGDLTASTEEHTMLTKFECAQTRIRRLIVGPTPPAGPVDHAQPDRNRSRASVGSPATSTNCSRRQQLIVDLRRGWRAPVTARCLARGRHRFLRRTTPTRNMPARHTHDRVGRP